MKKITCNFKKCIVCGEVFTKNDRSDQQWKVAKFCSKNCWSHRGQQITKKCENCGKEFSLPAHLMAVGKKREKKACSRECSYKLMSGDKSYMWKGKRVGYKRFRDALSNTNLYRNWRNEVKKRDNNLCVNCGKNESQMHVHHIYPLTQIIEDEGWNMDRWLELYNSPDSRLWKVKNGVTLCEDCHYSLISFALQSKGFSPE